MSVLLAHDSALPRTRLLVIAVGYLCPQFNIFVRLVCYFFSWLLASPKLVNVYLPFCAVNPERNIWDKISNFHAFNCLFGPVLRSANEMPVGSSRAIRGGANKSSRII